MVVGLGSGTTMAEVVKILGKSRVRATFIPASKFIERIAKKRGLRLSTLEIHSDLDLHLDGADEVDPRFHMIKGRGGAMAREKILAKAARRVVIVVDKTKLVRRLGKHAPVPVEVLPFAVGPIRKKLHEFGKPMLRVRSGGRPYLTDNGNYIFDLKCRQLSDPQKLERELNAIPGVVENGIFVGLVDELVVGHEGGVSVFKSGKEMAEFL